MITGSSHSKYLLLLIGLLALTLALMLASPARAQMNQDSGHNSGPSNLLTLNSTGPVTSVYLPPQARQTEQARQQSATTLLNSEAAANNRRGQPAVASAEMTGNASMTGAAAPIAAAGLAAANPGAVDGGLAWPVVLGWMIIVIGMVCLVLILGTWARRNRPPSHRPTLPRDPHMGLPV